MTALEPVATDISYSLTCSSSSSRGTARLKGGGFCGSASSSSRGPGSLPSSRVRRSTGGSSMGSRRVGVPVAAAGGGGEAEGQP